MDAYQLRGSRATCGRCIILHVRSCASMSFTWTSLSTSLHFQVTELWYQIPGITCFLLRVCNRAPPSGHPLANCNLTLADFIVNKRCGWHLPIPKLIFDDFIVNKRCGWHFSTSRALAKPWCLNSRLWANPVGQKGFKRSSLRVCTSEANWSTLRFNNPVPCAYIGPPAFVRAIKVRNVTRRGSQCRPWELCFFFHRFG